MTERQTIEEIVNAPKTREMIAYERALKSGIPGSVLNALPKSVRHPPLTQRAGMAGDCGVATRLIFDGKRDKLNRRVRAKVEWSDSCDNGENHLSVTADVFNTDGKIDQCGCCHDVILEVYPQLADAIRFHLCSSYGPLHYIANTVYLAGDRDHHGLRKGDPRRWAHFVSFDEVPIKFQLEEKIATHIRSLTPGHYIPVEVPHPRDQKMYGSKWTIAGHNVEWHFCPFDDGTFVAQLCEALNTRRVVWDHVPVAWGEGKERELDAARRAAIWPDATDEELSVEPDELRRKLVERLPALVAELKRVVESFGFVY